MMRIPRHRPQAVVTALLLFVLLCPLAPARGESGAGPAAGSDRAAAVQGDEASGPRETTADAVFELPWEAGDGPGREVTVLLDESHLKLALLTLRNGTILAPHSAPVPTTIQVLLGSGVIHVDGEPVRVVDGSLLALAAGAEHDVRPEEGSDMVLLVHYLRGAGPGAAADHEH